MATCVFEMGVLGNSNAVAAILAASGQTILTEGPRGPSVSFDIDEVLAGRLRFVAVIDEGWPYERFNDAVGALLICIHLAMPARVRLGWKIWRPRPADPSDEHSRRIADSLVGWEPDRAMVVNGAAQSVGWGMDYSFPTGDWLEHCARFARDLRWPRLENLPLPEVIAWTHGLDGWADGLGRGPVGRALAAFAAILGIEYRNELPPELIIWALAGLEALYCRNIDGIGRQLMSHSESLLGPRLENMKRFKAMYDARSKFLHGAVDLPYTFRVPNEQDRVIDEALVEADPSIRLREPAGIAVSMLAASLQELVRRGWHELEFHSTVSGQ